MGRPSNPDDLLMWVGAEAYPTVEDFAIEAERLGVSKRVPYVPKGIKTNSSYLFLLHDGGKKKVCDSCHGTGVRGGHAKLQLMKASMTGLLTPTPVVHVVTSAYEIRQVRESVKNRSGGTLVYRLASGQPICPKCLGEAVRPEGSIVGFCLITGVQLLFDSKEAIKEYRERAFVPPMLSLAVLQSEPMRRSGYRSIGATYLLSGSATDSCRDLGTKMGKHFTVRGPLVVFRKPIPWRGGRFRGFKAISRREIFQKIKGWVSGGGRGRRAAGSGATRRDRAPSCRRAKDARRPHRQSRGR